MNLVQGWAEVEVMNWVDHRGYFGPDRRQRAPGFRLLERRQVDLSQDAPSLRAVGRRLSLWALDVETSRNADALVEPLTGMVQLLQMRQVDRLANRLEHVVQRIKSRQPGADIAQEMRAIADRLMAGS
jgi:hypothetical protein